MWRLCKCSNKVSEAALLAILVNVVDPADVHGSDSHIPIDSSAAFGRTRLAVGDLVIGVRFGCGRCILAPNYLVWAYDQPIGILDLFALLCFQEASLEEFDHDWRHVVEQDVDIVKTVHKLRDIVSFTEH